MHATTLEFWFRYTEDEWCDRPSKSLWEGEGCISYPGWLPIAWFPISFPYPLVCWSLIILLLMFFHHWLECFLYIQSFELDI